MTADIITPKVKEVIEQRNESWFKAKTSGLTYTEIALNEKLNPDKYTPQAIQFALKGYCKRHGLSLKVLEGGGSR